MAMEEYLLPLRTPCVYHDTSFLSEDEATEAYEDLLNNTPWEKTPKINRWVTLMMDVPDDEQQEEETGEDETKRDYRYRDAPGAPLVGFPPIVHKLKTMAEEWYNSKVVSDGSSDKKPVKFNICLLNYYQNGTQRIGWHSDREEIGRSTPIASISLGCTRKFLIRSKTDGVRDRASIEMTNGSIILMENICQYKYLHSVPKESDVEDGRINLTFRCKEFESSDNAAGELATTEGELNHQKRDHWITQISTEMGALDSTAGSWKAGGARIADNYDGGGDDDDDDLEAKVFGDNAKFHKDYDGEITVEYVVKTNIGAECYCAAELEELLDIEQYTVLARPFEVAGYVAICRTTEQSAIAIGGEDERIEMEDALLQLRSAHHVLKYHDYFNLEDLLPDQEEGVESDKKSGIGSINGEMLYQYYKQKLVSGESSIPSLVELEKGGTFRVSCDRIGSGQGFTGPELEFEIGGAMSEFYTHIKPKMTDFDILIRADVVATKVIVGTQINVDDLSKQRHFLRFRNAVTLKTNLAYAMIRMANIKKGDLVCDPFCGSGTILLEALDVYRTEQIKCVGMDVSRRSANGARENAIAEGFNDDLCQFHCCDARNFKRHLTDESVDVIVSNLPWGVITGQKNVSDLQTMYEIFLRNAWYVLKDGGRIVMLVLRGLQLTRIIRKLSGRYRLLSVNVVRTTNNLPSIVVIEKLAVDEVRTSVKRQLGYLAQFVNVSSEMYSALNYEKIDETTL
ncbi:2OG-Fe(II) oxygenase family protein [Skeletonema marinoi]|uniref:2OG-Fe(II) oxygenase family protein n=1 Tax=Skeletonema marinoi TaxID=267567 RepID=A0AAD8XXW1_9STRA|nr:2OG-Fe(II) oxygenase family protein [Skeletonema marinoi]